MQVYCLLRQRRHPAQAPPAKKRLPDNIPGVLNKQGVGQ